MYWWTRAAAAVASGRTIRAGLITTNSITQSQNRALVEAAAESGARIMWAIPDHYWNDGSDDARVRIAMTVLAKDPPSATLVHVDGDAEVISTTRVPRLNTDLTAHADVAQATSVPLRANTGLTSFGFMLNGPGFILEAEEASRLLALGRGHADIIRRYRNGRDIAQRPRNVSLIDFGLRTLEEAQQYPVLLDIVRDRVKPNRDAARRAGVRERWWRFAEARPNLREALEGLPRYIATVETAIRRYFVFLDGDIAPDHMLIALASDDPFVLGVLSSSIHVTWALAAGSRLGIDATPRYNKGPCFEAFPFPDPDETLRDRIGSVAQAIDLHRRTALSSDPCVTMTLMYHVVAKLRSGEVLSAKERDVHIAAACNTLRDLHDQLDELVATAYGWAWPEDSNVVLERLVALHDQRVSEELRGQVRWLRPEFQQRKFADEGRASTPALELEESPAAAHLASIVVPWPTDAIGQIAALRGLATESPVSIDAAMGRFVGAKRDLVERHLETLAILGEVQRMEDGRYVAFTMVA